MRAFRSRTATSALDFTDFIFMISVLALSIRADGKDVAIADRQSVRSPARGGRSFGAPVASGLLAPSR